MPSARLRPELAGKEKRSKSHGLRGRTIPTEPVLSLNREVQKKGKSGENRFCPLANSKNAASHPQATFSGLSRLRIPLQQPHFDSAAIQLLLEHVQIAGWIAAIVVRNHHLGVKRLDGIGGL